MSSQPPNEAEIFNEARRIDSDQERKAYLDRVCGDDTRLRQRVQQLLAADGINSQFLEQAAVDQIANEQQEDQDLTMPAEGNETDTGGDQPPLIVGSAGKSVLQSLKKTSGVKSVSLRESKTEYSEPVQRVRSSEIPAVDDRGKYRLDGEIARGGMGAIIKGRDSDLGRDLAIKVLLDQHKDQPEVIQRFVEEAQIGGQLQHPGIVPVHELGQFPDKRPFFSMKLVKGQTLSKLLAQRPEVSSERGKFIGIFEQICQTMAYAHSRGVIHRDLKPSNVMVGAFGEVQVMDWGLAKVLGAGGVADEKTANDVHQPKSIIQTMRRLGSKTAPIVGSGTQMGSVLGTPAYMAPEQALGEIDQMDERADVFGLGGILSEILTGKPPYVAENRTKVFRMASRGKLAECFERLDKSGADKELVNLAKDCLALEPVDRPRDASALANRVTAHIESVETKLRESELQRASQEARADAEAAQAEAERRRAEAERQRAEAIDLRASEEHKRRRVQLALAACLLFTLSLGGGGWLFLERRESSRREAEIIAQRNHAHEMEMLAEEKSDLADAREVMRIKAEQATEKAEILAYDSAIAAAFADLQRNDQTSLRHRLESAPERLRGWEWDFLWTESDRSLATTLQLPHQSRGYEMQLSDDGSLVATDQHVGGGTEWINVYDTRTGEKVRSFKTYIHNNSRFDFSRDRRYLVHQFSGPPGVQIHDMKSGHPKIPWEQAQSFFRFLSLDHLGRSAFLVQRTGVISEFEFHVNGWKKIRDLSVRLSSPGRLAPINSAASPDGKTLLIGSVDREPIVVIDLKSNQHVKEIQVDSATVSIQFHEGSKSFRVLAADGSVAEYSSETWEPIQKSTIPGVAGPAIARHSDSNPASLLTFGDHGEVLFLDEKYRTRAQLRGHNSKGVSLAIDQQEQQIVTAHADGTIRRWDLHHQRSIRLSGANKISFQPGENTVWMCRTSRHENAFAQVSSFDLSTSQPESTFRWMPVGLRYHGYATGIAFSPDQERIAVSRKTDWGQGEWRTYHRETGLRLRSFGTHPHDVSCIKWSGDGRWIVLGTARYRDGLLERIFNSAGHVRIHNADTYEELAIISDLTGAVTDLEISPNSEFLVAACKDGTISSWTLPDGNRIHQLDPTDDLSIACLTFSQDGEHVVFGSSDGSITVWNPTSGESVFRKVIHGAAVTCVQLTPDGSRLVTGGDDQTLRFIDPKSWREIASIRLDAIVSSISFSSDGKQLAVMADELLFFDTEPASTRASERRLARETQQEIRPHVARLMQRFATDSDDAQSLTAETVEKIKFDINPYLAERKKILESESWDDAQRRAIIHLLRQGISGQWLEIYKPDNASLLSARRAVKESFSKLLFPQADDDRSNGAVVSAINRSIQNATDIGPMEQQVLIESLPALMNSIYFFTNANERLNSEVLFSTISRLVDPLVTSAQESQETYGYTYLAMSKVVQDQPGNSLYLGLMAAAEYRMGLYQDAIASAKASMKPDGHDHFMGHSIIAMSLHQMGKTDEAKQTFQLLSNARSVPEIAESDVAKSLFEELESVLATPIEKPWDEQAAYESCRKRLNELNVNPVAIASWELVHADRFDSSNRSDRKEHADHVRQLRQQIINSLESAIEDNPSDSDLVERLVQELLAQAEPDNRWLTPQPTEIISSGGATLTRKIDNSILASGNNPLGDVYSVTVAIDQPIDLAVIRLEALTDKTLPRGGPGRNSTGSLGNFAMLGFDVSRHRSDGETKSIVLSKVVSDYTKYNIPIKLNEWNCWGGEGHARTAYYTLATPVSLEPGDELWFTMRFSGNPEWPGENLGRFRFGLSDQAISAKQLRTRRVVSGLSDSWSKLVVAYRMLGREPDAQRILSQQPAAAIGLAELATAKGDLQAAISIYNEVITPETTDATLIGKRGLAYLAARQWEEALADAIRVTDLDPGWNDQAFAAFQEAKRWEEALKFGWRQIELNRNDSMRWIHVAPVAFLVDREAEYQDFCRQMIKQFANDKSIATCQRICHYCLLNPKFNQVPQAIKDQLQSLLEEGDYEDWSHDWSWYSLGIAKYRDGEFEEAIKCCRQGDRPQNSELSRALGLAVTAMAEHELGNKDAALESLHQLTDIVSRHSTYESEKNQDQLVARILWQEAKEKLQDETEHSPETREPDSNSDPPDKSSR